MSTSPAGWYPDPSGNTSKLRYWDGFQWTDFYQDTAASPVSGTGAVPVNMPGVPYPRNSSDQTLCLIAFIFNLLSCVGFGLLIIPLAWMIPMTVVSWGIYKGTRPNTAAFGVCTLIFVNMVAGICLLVADKND